MYCGDTYGFYHTATQISFFINTAYGHLLGNICPRTPFWWLWYCGLPLYLLRIKNRRITPAKTEYTKKVAQKYKITARYHLKVADLVNIRSRCYNYLKIFAQHQFYARH